MKPLAIVALGGNVISTEGESGNISQQFNNARRSLKYIAELVEMGFRLVLTHGNGPQIGNLLRRAEATRKTIYPLPLDTCGALTQGGMGYMLQQTFDNILTQQGFHKKPATLICQVLTDENDPAVSNPTKPIGPFFTKEQIAHKVRNEKWTIVELPQQGYRRVVPSPRPLSIIEESIIAKLVQMDQILITCGGGGVPVIEKDGQLKGVEAVIDKDLATGLLAKKLKADIMLIITACEKVALNYNKPNESLLDVMSVKEAKDYLKKGHFPPGSMGPKIEAAVDFSSNTGNPTIITKPEKIIQALKQKAGTWIVSDAMPEK